MRAVRWLLVVVLVAALSPLVLLASPLPPISSKSRSKRTLPPRGGRRPPSTSGYRPGRLPPIKDNRRSGRRYRLYGGGGYRPSGGGGYRPSGGGGYRPSGGSGYRPGSLPRLGGSGSIRRPSLSKGSQSARGKSLHDRVDPKLQRTKEWELATHVVSIAVAKFEHADREGKVVSAAGERFFVELSVRKVLKGKGVAKGDLLRLDGWQRGERAQRYIPKKWGFAFLRKKRAGVPAQTNVDPSKKAGFALLVPNGFYQPEEEKKTRLPLPRRE
jgi:hypothetical protein